MDKIKVFFPRQILIILGLVVVLNVIRPIVFHSTYFLYLFWNIFLAILPFAVSSILLWRAKHNKLDTPYFIIGGIFWLLLLPNAPYIITDLIHLGRNHAAPIFFDIFLLFSSAWLGLLLGLYSISHIEKILEMRYKHKNVLLIVNLILLIVSFGMYLGRFLRFNSWDVFYSTPLLFTHLGRIFIHPELYPEAYLFTIISFIFLYSAYGSWKYSLKESKFDL